MERTCKFISSALAGPSRHLLHHLTGESPKTSDDAANSDLLLKCMNSKKSAQKCLYDLPFDKIQQQPKAVLHSCAISLQNIVQQERKTSIRSPQKFYYHLTFHETGDVPQAIVRSYA